MYPRPVRPDDPSGTWRWAAALSRTGPAPKWSWAGSAQFEWQRRWAVLLLAGSQASGEEEPVSDGYPFEVEGVLSKQKAGERNVLFRYLSAL